MAWTDGRIVRGSRSVNSGCPEALPEAPLSAVNSELRNQTAAVPAKI